MVTYRELMGMTKMITESLLKLSGKRLDKGFAGLSQKSFASTTTVSMLQSVKKRHFNEVNK